MQAIPFPAHLDAPQRFLFWTADQAVPFAVMAFVGMATENLMICMFIGAGLGWGMGRYRDSQPDGHLMHAAYWFGILPLSGRACLNPFERRIFPQ